MKTLARWSELVFSCISLFLWSTLPHPPTARVMWNWVLLTLSVLLGITFFIWLKGGKRAAWICSGVWASLVVANLLLGIIRAGLPSLPSLGPAVVISFLLVYAWGFIQVLVLVAVIGWAFQQRSVRPLGA